MIYFTSDTHFGHANIIKYCSRPFVSVEEMDAEMIRRWNETVTPRDTVYHLGDFSLSKDGNAGVYLDQLNGTKYFVWGNHDRDLRRVSGLRLDCPGEDIRVVRHSHQKVVLCHYAMRVWDGSHHGAWHLYGHSHGQLPDAPDLMSFDVGVDCHDFRPISWDQVERAMALKLAARNQEELV